MTVREVASNTNQRSVARRGLWVAALAVALGGCRFAQQAVQAVILEPIYFAEYLEEKHEHRLHRRVAKQVWLELQETEPLSVSPDYERGFLDGFVDFMLAGGTGRPPAFPPKDYWKTRYQTHAGQQAIMDWYAGFEFGASVAHESGYRDLVTLPLSDYPYEPNVPYSSLGEGGGMHWPNRRFQPTPEFIQPAEELPPLDSDLDL